MSQADFLEMQPLFSAITGDALKKPNIPMPIFLQEAENLLVAATHDKDALLEAGFDVLWLESMPAKIGALNQAESIWFKERDKRDEAQKSWDTQAPEAYALRDQLLRSMRYAYRNHPDLMDKVVAIAEGAGHADMIADLHKLAVLGRDFAEPLVAIKLDLALLDRAQDTADEMGTLLALLMGERSLGSAPRLARDQAYTLLKQAVDEVRACGQYVFWNDERRRDEYSSHYLRNMRRQASKKNQESVDSTPDQA